MATKENISTHSTSHNSDNNWNQNATKMSFFFYFLGVFFSFVSNIVKYFL